MSELSALMSGLLAGGYGVAGLFFLRFWRQAHDRLFLFFAVSFWLLALQRVLLTLWARDDDAFMLFYGLRAFAFLLILWAIVDKNRKPDE